MMHTGTLNFRTADLAKVRRNNVWRRKCSGEERETIIQSVHILTLPDLKIVRSGIRKCQNVH